VNPDNALCTLNRLFSPLSAPSGYGDVVVLQVPEGNGFRFFGAQPAADGSGYTFIYTYGATGLNRISLI